MTHTQAAELAIAACGPLAIAAVGHRVVHGGPRYHQPVRVTPDVVDELHALGDLAPLHNEPALQGIEVGQRLLPNASAVAVFDTAFHHDLPPVAAAYALPLELAERYHLRRYGFHGLSHRYVSERLLYDLRPIAPDTATSRVVTCHLGHGASVTAVRGGRSVDTSMGLTPLEGLVMGTRSGDLDPGLVLYLIRGLGMSVNDADELLNDGSGLLGVSGLSSDVRDLEQAASEGDPAAGLALELFAYRVRKYIGAYAAVLGGVDAVVFTGGIGEHSPAMRGRICDGLAFLGLVLDAARNATPVNDGPAQISAEASPVAVWVIPTDEEWQIARETFRLLETPCGGEHDRPMP